MEIRVLYGVTPASEVHELVTYPFGFYIINDTLWLKDKSGIVTFIWSEIGKYIDIPDEDEKEFTTLEERGDTISEEFLLKVLAIAKEPSLIKDI